MCFFVVSPVEHCARLSFPPGRSAVEVQPILCHDPYCLSKLLDQIETAVAHAILYIHCEAYEIQLEIWISRQSKSERTHAHAHASLIGQTYKTARPVIDMHATNGPWIIEVMKSSPTLIQLNSVSHKQ